ncbi:virulence RhuM family protein [Dysgonomonas sp. HDW5B]|uniref:virulence RhuM family protein n=1 Tax=Dysgonomonas sp. HDW5B TaxID=2714927 RepID=UPI00140B24C2|nr:virulence RhuM family protein [Dysgonomonas sp. HDW5B]QIK54099.1 virulence RhuM family protein [Dysgonomonas sp. HDW5B]
MENELDNQSQFLFYQGNDGTTKIQVIFGDETVWATQKSMSEIFDVEINTINYHIKNIFESKELKESSTIRKIRTVQTEGQRNVSREIEFYNLDVIISVGYRVSSYKATQFRIWATSVLKEYLVKGFALDDDRLKQGKEAFGKDYFDELLERIREIRSSERRFYQKITDIYAQCSIDYDPNSTITHEFYATVQNKLHFAIHNNTAAELVKKRADSRKPNMGLTSWKNEKKGGKILKSDVSNAKNYLYAEELDSLNRVVSMYLDFAENLAKRQKVMKMVDWVARLDAFLGFNEYNILDNAGKISAKLAKQIAEEEYQKFRITQDQEYISDFDKIVDEIKTTNKLPKTKKDFGFSIKDALGGKTMSEFNEQLNKALNKNPQNRNKDSQDENFNIQD